MALANRLTQQLGFEEIIRQCASWCVETGSRPSEMIGDSILELCSPEAVDELAIKGLVFEVGSLLHSDRSACVSSVLSDREEHSRRGGLNVAQGRNPNAAGVGSFFSPLDIPMVGADGIMKALREFTLADLASLHRVCVGRRQGWQQRETWCEQAQAALRGSKARKISELEASQVAALEQSAGEVWQKKGGAR